MKNITEMTLEELRAVPYCKYNEIGPFYEFVIVPTGELHDSGFGCMKFVLLRNANSIIGAVGGGSDVIHLNGPGGYGSKWQEALTTGRVPVTDWNMDLLPKSGCIRVFSGHRLMLESYVCSDFNVYDGGKR